MMAVVMLEMLEKYREQFVTLLLAFHDMVTVNRFLNMLLTDL